MLYLYIIFIYACTYLLRWMAGYLPSGHLPLEDICPYSASPEIFHSRSHNFKGWNVIFIYACTMHIAHIFSVGWQAIYLQDICHERIYVYTGRPLKCFIVKVTTLKALFAIFIYNIYICLHISSSLDGRLSTFRTFALEGFMSIQSVPWNFTDGSNNVEGWNVIFLYACTMHISSPLDGRLSAFKIFALKDMFIQGVPWNVSWWKLKFEG